MMFCKQCGCELKDGAIFCTNCGVKQVMEAPAVEPVLQAPDLDKTVGIFGDVPETEKTMPMAEQAAPVVEQPQYVQPEYTIPEQQPTSKIESTYPHVAVANAVPQDRKEQGKAPSNGKVSFFQAIKLMFINCVNFTGRASKSEYWWAFLFLSIIGTIGSLVTLVTAVPLMNAAQGTAFLLPNLSLNVRRLHDIGKPWPWLLMGLIPGAGAIILLVYYLRDSDGDNQWGPGLLACNQAPDNGNVTPQPAYNPAQPEYMPAQPAYENTQGVFSAAPQTVQPQQIIVDDNVIIAMAQNHEPLNLYTPEAKEMMDAAISRIIPTYTGAVDVETAMLQCNPQEIKDRVAATDTDTLLVIFKALGYYVGIGANPNVLGLVQQNVLSVLKTRF